MEISEKANDRKLEALTTTLMAKMDSNQNSLVADNASIKASNQSILAGLQQLMLRPPLAAPSPEAVAGPVHEASSNPIAVPVPDEALTSKQSRSPLHLALPPNKVDQDEESPRKQKSEFGDLTEIREQLYNKADNQQHHQQYQHQHQHQQYNINTLTPDHGQACK